MSNAELLVAAVDTALTVVRWAVGWLIFGATVASILILAAAVTGARGIRAVWRRTGRPSWAYGPVRARILARTRTRCHRRRLRPLWAYSQPLGDGKYDEAA